MKKILLIFALLFCSYVSAQKPYIDYLRFDQKTTIERDAITIPATQTGLIFNFNTGNFEYKVGVGPWTALDGGGTFPGFTSLLSDYSFTDNSTNWNTAFAWGNHGTQGYLTSFTEIDPTYSAVASSLINRTATNYMTNGSVLDFQPGSSLRLFSTPTFYNNLYFGATLFDASADVGKDNYVVTYDFANNKYSLEAASGGGSSTTIKNSFTADGSTTAWTLSSTPNLGYVTQVFLNENYLVKDTDYTISGTTFTIIGAWATPTNSTKIEVFYNVSGEPVGNIGDMLKTTYDPTNINASAFDYNNFINTPTIPTNTDYMDLTSFQTVTSQKLYNSGSGIYNISSTNINGVGIQSTNTSGKGIYSIATGAGDAFVSSNPGGSTGNGFIALSNNSNAGYNYVGQNNEVNTFTVNRLGDVIGKSFVGDGSGLTNVATLDPASPIKITLWGGTEAQFNTQFPSGAPANYLSVKTDATPTPLTASDITDFDTEVSNNTSVAANTSKTGITAQQATDITTNNSKVSYTDASKVANITVTQAVDLDTIESDTATNNSKLTEDKFEVIQIACSDLTTDITTGTSKAYFRMPYAAILTDVRCSLLDAGTVTGVTVDINESGVTILSTKLTTDSTEETSQTATTSAVISDSTLADDAKITIDFDAVPTAGKGVILTLILTRT